MLGRNKVGVREERSGKRDLSLSSRRRMWGRQLPAMDLDFCDYDNHIPVLLWECKSIAAWQPKPFDPLKLDSVQTLTNLANMATLPAILAYYWEIWAFLIYPLNNLAREHFENQRVLSEREFVEKLYLIRNRNPDQTILAGCNTKLPKQIKFYENIA